MPENASGIAIAASSDAAMAVVSTCAFGCMTLSLAVYRRFVRSTVVIQSLGQHEPIMPSGQGTKLARSQESHRIGLLAQGQLVPIGIETAPILQLEDMRVIENTAVLFERPHDLVQTLFRRIANEGQPADPATALLFCIFMVHQNLVAKAGLLLADEPWFERVRHDDLEIGPAAINLKGHQCGVIECRLVNAAQIGGGAFGIIDRHRTLSMESGGE